MNAVFSFPANPVLSSGSVDGIVRGPRRRYAWLFTTMIQRANA